MNKKEFNKIVKATGKNVEVVKALNDETYFLYVDGELAFSDTACEEIYNYETALCFYADLLLDKYVHEEKKIFNVDRWELKPIGEVSGIKPVDCPLVDDRPRVLKSNDRKKQEKRGDIGISEAHAFRRE